MKEMRASIWLLQCRGSEISPVIIFRCSYLSNAIEYFIELYEGLSQHSPDRLRICFQFVLQTTFLVAVATPVEMTFVTRTESKSEIDLANVVISRISQVENKALER